MSAPTVSSLSWLRTRTGKLPLAVPGLPQSFLRRAEPVAVPQARTRSAVRADENANAPHLRADLDRAQIGDKEKTGPLGEPQLSPASLRAEGQNAGSASGASQHLDPIVADCNETQDELSDARMSIQRKDLKSSNTVGKAGTEAVEPSRHADQPLQTAETDTSAGTDAICKGTNEASSSGNTMEDAGSTTGLSASRNNGTGMKKPKTGMPPSFLSFVVDPAFRRMAYKLISKDDKLDRQVVIQDNLGPLIY